YVSDVIGAYVGSNYIGMYVPETVEAAAKTRGYDIPYDPEDQAYAGKENPNGQRFEGIIRWATPVTDSSGKITGYVTFALNHDHLMELVDHITPMDERYTEMPSAFEGNYAFIWDYKCRSICHPRHNSIVGYDPQTGEPQVPWLESSIYDAWQKSGVKNWNDFIIGWPEFDSQSRKKVPAPALTKAGLVGLDGRYLNNAPQCTGWMDLTKDGGSGSFYILWSGLYKLTTAAAIPYYTGQYAPSASNNFSKRGFGIVTIGAGLDDFTQPAQKIGVQLHDSMGNNLTNTLLKSLLTLVITVILVTLIAIRIASFLTESISKLISGMSRFRAGERQFRFNLLVQDEFGTLAEAFNMMADNIENSESGPLTIIGMDYRVIYMNEQGLALLNATLKNTIGRPYSEVSLYPQGSKYDPIIALQNSAEAEALYHDTSRRYFKGLANYFLDKNGNKIGYIISSVDVTEIQAAVKAADQASRAKGDFLSNMSHEIRTPLNAIIGMTSMGISATELNRKDYCLGKIHEASRHLLGVINDILDMSKIEANKLELSPVKFVFEKMLQRVIDVIGFRIGEKEQHLNIDVDKNIPLVIIADEQWFAQVITNLLSNANKFTPRGGTIRLDAVLLEENDGVCTIEVKVTDTGIGISEEQIPKLFKVFEQAERSTSRKFGGTGLGLAISKRIVEMMDGEIKVESQPGKGSVFSFFIKARRGEETRESLLSPGVNWRNVRILAIDDDPVVQEYFKSIGEQLNLTYDVAGSGREALDMITKNGQYDLYFVDWNMPGMNGIELSKQINKDMNNKHVIVMISSIEWVVIEAEAREVGVSRFIQKPLFISAIADCINEVLGKPTEPVKALVDSFEDRCVLLAEDVEINREIVIALLEPTKLKIDCAENGAEAVKLFSGSPEKYDMIFMDVQMPEVDGYEATRRIRAMEIPKAKSIPIIAMTANVFREDIEQCLAVGMNDHIGKPLNFDEVMTKLRRYLSK
ncbi:MAG: response regulator, partial [Treponema sp.]|nr:response regulator [Treponema sp.]